MKNGLMTTLKFKSMKTPYQTELYAQVVAWFQGRCGLNPAHAVAPDATPHHILPRGAGGQDVAENLIPLCAECHCQVHQEGTRKWRARLVEISRLQRSL